MAKSHICKHPKSDRNYKYKYQGQLGSKRTETTSYSLTLSNLYKVHCKQDPIYVCPEMKLRALVPDFHIQVSVSDLYIPTIGPPILHQQNR